MSAEQSMTFEKTFEKLVTNGWVESNSPKNRKKIYALLNEKKINYRTQVIGYTSGKRCLSRWSGCRSIGWDLGRIVKWIAQKRILESDLREACEVSGDFDFDKIKSIFSTEVSTHKKYEIIQREWGYRLGWVKWTPFDYCSLRKTIVRIELVSSEM
ncbi:hypothetical protein QJ856_gp0599 [Tupanvirus deep ocean]|uniref:Uncharacterized protein n=2 Tax=Tupanvirus TaxID=2094720 RepID=A0AC62A8P1_9VIRU|nr:hypothetical protein QJ856_gp0599 [Tupanvirus deep ocean]QKU34147.1 hypothetical protein [Tupanvirus deep ocean]